MNIFLISNMYPSSKDPSYGVFVKNFKEGMESHGVVFSKEALIKGKGRNNLIKFFKYIKFYYEIIYKGFFSDFDFVYVHTVTHTSIPLRFLLFFRKMNIILNPHGEDIMTNRKRSEILLKFSAEPLIIKSSLVVSPSYFFKKILQNKFKIPGEKVFVSSSGGVPDFFFTKTFSKDIKPQIVLGFVSRIAKKKGWHVLLEALKVLSTENIHNFKCIIIGDGEDTNLLLRKTAELGLQSLVEYRGSKSQSELKKVYKELDLFIFPTLYQESLGLVGLEAMASGIPVVGSNRGGLTDYIQDGRNGYFFEPEDHVMLKEKISNYILLSNEEKVEMRVAAIETAKNYEYSLISEKLYQKLKTLSVTDGSSQFL